MQWPWKLLKTRHREARSDAAIHAGLKSWIATACGLAKTAQ
jgi:hypothetical protein